MKWKNINKIGTLNDYFKSKMPNMLSLLDGEEQEAYLDIANTLSKWDVASKNEESIGMAVLMESPDIIYDIKKPGYPIEDSIIEDIQKSIYTSGLLSKTDIYCAVALVMQDYEIPIKDDVVEICNITSREKLAYPQAYSNEVIRPIYSMDKWVQAAREIVKKEASVGFNKAFNQVTSSWDTIETLNFKYWLRYYTEGGAMKYPKLAQRVYMKTAQHFENNGLFFPFARMPEREDDNEAIDLDKIDLKKKKEDDVNDVRDRIEQQRSKILSRLTSAERLLASLDGQGFAGEEQELMLKLLQDLKRKVQVANKITIRSSLFEDLIFRAGNYMKEAGSPIGKAFFYKIAQNPFDMPLPGADPMADPGGALGAPGGDLGGSSDPKQDTKNAFIELKRLLVDGVYDEDEKEEDQKKLAPPASAQPSVAPAAPAAPDAPDAPLAPSAPPAPPVATADRDFDIIVTAQEVVPIDEIGTSEVLPRQDKPNQNRPKLPTAPEEVRKELIVTDEDQQPEDNTDDVIDAALSNISIHDAISRLEVLVGIYKKREVPRQLTILDLMMDTLGLSSFFPSLGEAMAKSLESSQYISTRLEDTLNKLKGSIESKDGTDWVTNRPEPDPETAAVQKRLQDDADREKGLKEMRKNKENAKLEGEKAPTNVGEQAAKLNQPAAIEAGKPIQVR